MCRFTIHDSRFTKALLATCCVATTVVGIQPPAVAQAAAPPSQELLCQHVLSEPAPPPASPSPPPPAAQPAAPELTIDADQLTYDDVTRIVEATGHVALKYRGITVRADFARILRAEERLEARGHVIVIDSENREMRGEMLTYEARTEVAELSPAEAIINGVHISSHRMRAQPGLIVAGESTLTTCDPANPAFRVTAERIEVIPGDSATAYQATFWLGRHWLLGLPVVIVSLRGPEETAGSFPRFGYDHINGLWESYRYAFFVGRPLAYVSATLGTLAQRAEAGLLLRRPIGTLPLSLNASVSAGWHRETALSVETTRLQYSVGLQTSAIQLGPETDWQTSWNWQDATYATGNRQNVLRTHSAITHRLDTDTTLTLGYDVLRVYGATPLAIDAIDPADFVDKLSLTYRHDDRRDEAIATTFTTGISYDYLVQAPSISVSYGERIAKRYHWQVGPEYNLTTHAVTLISDTGVALGTDTYFTVQAEYNATTALFNDLDYILTAQIADCFDVSVKYRQVRQELWISIGLSALPQAAVQFQLQGP